MINKSGLIGIAAIVAAGFAAPAIAQEHVVTAYGSGHNAFAMVSADEGDGSFAPGATGGGSFGYNENVNRSDW